MTEEIPKTERPLSPHLQVYRLPMTALLSISHRITGVALILGAVFISAWFITAVMGEQYYNQLMEFSQTWVGTAMIFGWSVALFYHLSNGIRHMLWDGGVGLNKSGAFKGNVIVLLSTIILTAGVWSVCLSCSGDYNKTRAANTPNAEQVSIDVKEAE